MNRTLACENPATPTDHPLAHDPQDFQARKQALREQLQRSLPDSSAVLAVGLRLAAFHEEGAFPQDVAPGAQGEPREDVFLRWARQSFALGEGQTQKYLRVARCFSRAEVVGKTLGIESLNQIALADLRLRPTLWTLAQEERLSSGALAEGRQAGRGVLRGEGGEEGDYEAAVAATTAAARRRARRQDRAGSGGSRGREAAPLALLAQTLSRAIAQVEGLLQEEVAPGDAAAQARVQGQLQSLQALCGRLALRLAEARGAEGALSQPQAEAAGAAVGGERAATVASDRAAGEQAAGEQAAGDRAAGEQAAGDRAAGDQAASPAGTGGPALAPGDALGALAAAGAAYQPVVLWLQALPPRRRDLLMSLLVGVLVGTCKGSVLALLLDHRVPLWDIEEPPTPHFKRWRDALVDTERRAQTALRTLAAVDPTQLLFMLPRLLDLLTDREQAKGLGLLPAAPELRALATRYGAAVAWLRAQGERDEQKDKEDKDDKDEDPPASSG